MSTYIKIGKLAASHGVKGDLILEHRFGKKTTLKGLKAIFIEEFTDRFLPYFIESVSVRSEQEVLIKLEGINDRESARKLTPKQVWIPEAAFKQYAAASAPISLLGFSIFQDDALLGEVIEVIEQPHQILCTILYKGKEALIPVHEESLEKMDVRQRRLDVQLPEGLLDLYE
jgi:16S rRNA processing protein RimM